MIVLPSHGIYRSVNKHNCDLGILCDWVEASAIFQNTEVSQEDVIDELLEQERYAESDFAREMVGDAWNEISRRAALCGSAYALGVEGNWIRCVSDWASKSAHAFCLMLSIAINYDWWNTEFGNDYTRQGDLFERLVDSSLTVLTPSWTAFRTGWNPENALRHVKDVAAIIHGDTSRVEERTSGQEKDMGLDILYYRPFPDGRPGFPYFMVQCASGANWQDKLTEPNLQVWNYAVGPPTAPMRGFAVPFCLSEEKFLSTCVPVTGMVLDRCRLLGASKARENWLPAVTATGMVDWMQARVETLADRSL